MKAHPPGLLSARQLLRQAGLRPKKSWGQNFLEDLHILQGIAAAAAPCAGHRVVELGAGLGALTYPLLQTGAHVVAVEGDRKLAACLHATLGHWDRLEVWNTDALALNYAQLAQTWQAPLWVAGNLPYQISNRIGVALAHARGAVAHAVLLLQREVAQRWMAPPGSRTYGLLSVLMQRTFTVEDLADVPPEAFYPPPQVHSKVVRLQVRAHLASPERDAQLVAAARAAFGNRRKMLRNVLAAACHVSRSQVEAVLQEAGVAPEARAESLSLEDLTRLGALLAAQGWLEKEGV